MNYIDGLFYTKEHIWIKHYKENQYSLGITNFAQDLLGDIVYIDLTLGNKFNLLPGTKRRLRRDLNILYSMRHKMKLENQIN